MRSHAAESNASKSTSRESIDARSTKSDKRDCIGWVIVVRLYPTSAAIEIMQRASS
jgi:hypothetical protein